MQISPELQHLIIATIIKSVISAFVLLTVFAYTTLAERKVAALLQTRLGPNRAGPFGFLQPAADGLKLAFKETFIPSRADKPVYLLAPVLTMVPALVILAVVPWGPPLSCCTLDISLPGLIPATTIGVRLFDNEPMGITDVNVGMLYILSIASIAVYGVVLAGWASNNKYAMLGGIRSSAQMVSYELALGLSVIGPLMLAGSMSIGAIVDAQKNIWFIWLQPLAAVIFYIAALAEVNRAPFDMPEAEQELTAGYHTEYTAFTWSMFFMGEYIKMIGVSAIFASLFLGGWRGPFAEQFPILGLLYFWLKIAASLVFMIWTRSTHPRLRYDRLMAFGWKVLLPISLANVVVTAAGILAADAGQADVLWWTAGGLMLIGLGVVLYNFYRLRFNARPVKKA